MDNNKTRSSISIKINPRGHIALGIVLVVLKLFGVIDWSWWVVTIPLYWWIVFFIMIGLVFELLGTFKVTRK